MSLTKMELAKSKIALHAGFWISLTAKLQWIPDSRIPTACTDGRCVRYNPEWIESLTVPQVIGLALHEVGHNMLAHPSRARGFKDHECAQIAMDVVLNRKLIEYFEESKATLHAELPPGGIFGPQWEKYDEAWGMERIYNDLKEQKEKNGGKLPPLMDTVEPGVNEDGSPQSEAEADALQKEWTMAAQQAATMAKSRGSLPGMWEQFVADMVKPQINWRAQLRDVFTKIAKDEVSWRRFNRRFMHNGMYLPGMYSERLGLVHFYTDTSGSMGSEEFKLGLGAMNEIFEEVTPEQIRFVQCDTRIVHDEIIVPDDLPIVTKPFKGRGGTELAPLFRMLKKSGDEPELVVCLTDGHIDQIDRSLEPRCPMVWLVTTEHTSICESSFGRVIRVEA